MTATEVARNFSAALNRVAAGEKIEILRNGVTVALLGPPKRRLITVERFRELPHPSTATSLPTSVDPRRCRAAGGPLAVLIDTDLIVEAERGALVRLEDILGEEERAISVITVSELLHGVHRARGRRRARRRAFVERILASLDPVPITEAVARVHAEVWGRAEPAW